MCVCKQLPSNQSYDKQISSHQKGGGVSRWGEWVGKATAYKFDTCTLIGVHSTMHLVDPIKVHVSYTRVFVCVCVCVSNAMVPYRALNTTFTSPPVRIPQHRGWETAYSLWSEMKFNSLHIGQYTRTFQIHVESVKCH